MQVSFVSHNQQSTTVVDVRFRYKQIYDNYFNSNGCHFI